MSKEDWENAAKINRGEGEWPGYDTLKAWIRQTPKTMLPGLLRQLIYCCLAESVFREGKLTVFVSEIIEKYAEPGHGILRNDEE